MDDQKNSDYSLEDVESTVLVADSSDADTESDGEMSSASDQSTVYLSLENLIKSNLTTIDNLQKQYREQKEMVDNVLENDQTYRNHLEQAKEANRVKSVTKQEIMKRPDVIRIAEKMKALKEEAKETQATLSDLLQEFQRVSGSNVIEREDGQILEIVSVSKLVRK